MNKHNYGHIEASNPTPSVNDEILYERWLNITTGEVFVCTDNTPDFNVWIGNQGTEVVPPEEYWFNTSVAMPFNTDLLDHSSFAHSVTTGTVELSSVESVYGGKSALFSGSNLLSVTHSTEQDISTGDWTLEGWFNPLNLTGNVYAVDKSGGAGTSPVAFYRVGATMGLFCAESTGAWDRINNLPIGTMSIGSWCHLAAVRHGDNYRTYKDGVKVSDTTVSGNLRNSTGSLNIGGHTSSGYFNGYIDDFRLTKAVARYNENFTPSENQIG